jgi:Domain of unknown function (DUF4438)
MLTKSQRSSASRLVELSVHGDVTSAVWPAERPYRIGSDGRLRVLPGTGGICYSHVIGDSAIDIRADHVEPGVTIKASKADENSALNTLSCVGNSARLVSGAAKGDEGTVVGFHGAVEHVMVDFPQRTMEKMAIGDRVQIRAVGCGLEEPEWGDVMIMNCAPRLLEKWGVRWVRGALEVPVTHLVPAKVMGSGYGAPTCHRGDHDIQIADHQVVQEYSLSTLRFGDFVALIDADHSFGRSYLGGAVSIGLIVHSRSDMSGHGPGVSTLLTSRSGLIRPKISKDANVGHVLKLGRWRTKK